MNTIGIWANIDSVDKEKLTYLLPGIIRWLKERQCSVLLNKGIASHLGGEFEGRNFDELSREIDCLMVLGGDGALLNCARMIVDYGIPLFGVNLGHLGFLTETELPELYNTLENLLNGHYRIEEKMMLEARVERNGEVIEKAAALNDVVITKGGFARIIFLETLVNGELFTTYPADGLIIASPTGSTAYSLSAGGPLVVPDLDLMIVTPICPHALWARPLVISPNSELKATLLSEQSEVMLTVDGQQGIKLQKGDSVIVNVASYRVKFLKMNNRSFFNILRQKLRQGDIDGR